MDRWSWWSRSAVGRRSLRWVALLLGAGLVTAACSASDTGGEQGDAPASVQELVVGVGADPWVEAEIDRKRIPNYPLNTDVCETLVHLGTDFQLEPMLASEWEFVGDNTYRFTLNEGARYSDGRPVTVEDIKYSIDYTVREPQIGNSFLGAGSVTIVDERTVDIRPEQPNLRLIDEIDHPTYAVISPGDDPLSDENVTCTGPFKVVSYMPEQELVVERNENYWGAPAKLDKITFRFFPDDTTRVLALQNGAVDLINEVPHGILASLENQPGIKTQRAPVGYNTLMYLARRDAEGKLKVLNDPLVRRAVAASIDGAAYVEGVLDGRAEDVETIAPPAVLGEFADLVQGIPYDPTETARLLDQAGWARNGDGIRTKNGQPLQLKIIFDRTDIATVEFVQAQLRAVGIDGRIAQLDPGANRAAQEAGDYDISVTVPNQNNANPAFLMTLQFYSKARGPGAAVFGPGPGTAFDALIDRTQQASDPTELRRLSAEAMHELVDVEVAAVNLAGGYRIFAMKENVQGVEMHPSNTNQRWSTVYLTD
jgi:peptide/nickel transport system substrate-binding protein